MKRLRTALLCAVFAAALFFSHRASALDYTSASFILRDPVFTDEGGYSSSASFQNISATGQTNDRRSASVSFIHCAGFLYFVESTTEPCPDAAASVTPPSTGGNNGGGTGGYGGIGITPALYVPPQPKKPAEKCFRRGDVNDDCKVDLVDFSIAAYWYKRPLPARFLAVEKSKLSGDGQVTLRDFSIMAYWWKE